MDPAGTGLQRRSEEVSLNSGFARSSGRIASGYVIGLLAAAGSPDIIVSRLAENPAMSEETIRALAGHVSKQMPAIQHIRIHAKETAISGLEGAEIEDSAREAAGERAQNWAQSLTKRLRRVEKALNFLVRPLSSDG